MKTQVLPNYENVEGSRAGRQTASPSPSMMTQVINNINNNNNNNNNNNKNNIKAIVAENTFI